MSTLTQFFSSGGSSQINSIQRLFVNMYYQGTSKANTISSVDTSKTLLNYCGNSWDNRNHAVRLTSSTNVQIYQESQSTATDYVSIEVIEYV
jgi:hypothetical protein